MSIVSRPDYANVVGKLGIDHAVSPRIVTAKQIFGLLNTGAIISRMPLSPSGDIEIQEIEVLPGTPATRATLAQLSLPPQCLIVAIIHESYVRVPGAQDRLYAGDTVVALVENTAVEQTVKMFSPNGT